MYGYIYRIADLTNGKCYIGQHKYDKPMLDPYYHGSDRIIKQIYQKRPETLLEEILMICYTLEEMNYFETYFIEHMNTLDPFGYNLNTGGDSREGMTAWNKGKHGIYSTEYIKKLSESHKGKTTHMKGKHHTEETKQKISNKLKGRKHIQDNEKRNQTYKTNHPRGKKDICPFMIYKYRIIDKLSYQSIANIFNVSRSTIIKKFRKLNHNNNDKNS